MQGRCLNKEISNAFPAALTLIVHGDMRPHISQHIQYPRTCGVDSDVIQAQTAACDDRPSDKEVRRRTDVPRHRDLARRMEAVLLHWKDGNARSTALKMDTEPREHLLSMVA